MFKPRPKLNFQPVNETAKLQVNYRSVHRNTRAAPRIGEVFHCTIFLFWILEMLMPFFGNEIHFEIDEWNKKKFVTFVQFVHNDKFAKFFQLISV